MKTTELNFIEAVQAAKARQMIRRASWCAAAMIRHLICEGDVFYTCMGNTVEGKYVFNCYDYLANDWEIVPEPPKPMTFMEAIKHLREHDGIVTRRDADVHMDRAGNVVRSFINVGGRSTEVHLDLTDIEADDWIGTTGEYKERFQPFLRWGRGHPNTTYSLTTTATKHSLKGANHDHDSHRHRFLYPNPGKSRKARTQTARRCRTHWRFCKKSGGNA